MSQIDIENNVELKKLIFSQGFNILAVLQVGSQSTPSLCDSHSDCDLVIIVNDPHVYYECPIRYKQDLFTVHWKYMSLTMFLDAGKEHYDSKLVGLNRYCYAPVGINTFLMPLYVTSDYKSIVDSINWNQYRVNIAKHELYHYQSYIHQLLSEKYCRQYASKKLHYLIYSLYIIKDKEDELDWEQLRRIKRCAYVALTPDDVEFINKSILEMVEYI